VTAQILDRPAVGLADAPPQPPRVPRLAGIGPGELAVLGFALLLPLAFALQVFTPFLAPKAALLLALLGPGLVALALACRRGDHAAWWAAGFVGIAAISTLLSAAPVLSLFGEYGSLNGLLFVAALAGAWALGRGLGARSRALLVTVLLVGALVNAAFAWLQSFVELTPTAFHLSQGRALGFMSNPVQLGALGAGALWLAVLKVRTSMRPWLWIAGVAVLAGAVQLSGSRIALAAGVGASLVAAVRADRRKALAVVGALLMGVLLANFAPLPGGSSTSRVAGASASGLGPRVALWTDAVDAIAERPVIGYGPGRFATAVSPHTSVEVARYTGGDVLYADAHNFIVEYATTTGLLGLILLAGWLITSGRRARGPLVGFVIAVALSMLLQPQYVGLTPLVALALGAAGPGLRLYPGPGSRARPAVAGVCILTALIGLGFGAVLMAGDAAYRDGINTRSVATLERADELFPPWPNIPARLSAFAVWQRVMTNDTKYEAVAEAAAAEAIRRDPSEPQSRFTLGSLEEAAGRPRAADRRYREALDRNPWSVTALSARYRVAVKQENFDTANDVRDQLCQLGRDACPPPPAKFKREMQVGAPR
jgi:hypothetical protein